MERTRTEAKALALLLYGFARQVTG